MNQMDNNSKKLKKYACAATNEVITAFDIQEEGYSENEVSLIRKKFGGYHLFDAGYKRNCQTDSGIKGEENFR